MVKPLKFKAINMEKVYVHEYNVAINGILQKVKQLLITQTLIIWLSNNKAIIMQYPLTLYGQKMKRSVHNADLKSCKGDLVTRTSIMCFPDRKK